MERLFHTFGVPICEGFAWDFGVIMAGDITFHDGRLSPLRRPKGDSVRPKGMSDLVGDLTNGETAETSVKAVETAPRVRQTTLSEVP